MASTYSDLKIELIGTGEQTGTWGTTTNDNFSIAIGEAITGSADVAFSSADVTLTLTNTNASQAARNLRLNLTGTSGGARQLILGSGCQIEKLYLVNNGLADAVTIKNTSGTGIVVPAGKSMFVYNNGTNVVDAITYLSAIGTGVFDAGTVSAPSITFTGDTNTGIYSPAADTIGFTEGGVEALRLNANGQTSTSIAGTASLPSFTRTGDENTGIFFPAADTIAFTEGGVESMRIDSSGNLGIATTSPTYKLQIQSGASTILAGADSGALTLTDATQKVMRFGVPHYTNAEEPVGALFVSNESGANNILIGGGTAQFNAATALQFYTAANTTTTTGTERMRIDSSGNVGIGTSSPNYNLHINSSSAASYLQFTNTGSGTTILDGFLVGNDATGANLIQRESLPIITYTANIERMRITAAGAVGIGTSSPSSTLTVGGNPPTAGAIAGVGAAAGISLALSDNVNCSLYVRHPAAGPVIGTDGGNALRFATNGNAASDEKMRIDTNGNLGIGTSTPDAKLTVSGAAAFSAGTALLPSIAQTGDLNTGFWFPVADTIAASTAGTERMRIDSSGNVGIGTNSPVSVGSFRTLTVKSTNATQGGLIELNTNANEYQMQIGVSNNENFVFTVNNGALRFGTNNTERMRIDSSGKVLIGATSSTAGNAGYNVLIGGISSPMLKFQSTTGPSAWDIYSNGGADLRFAYNTADIGTFSQTTGVYTPLSDKNKKKDFEDSFLGLAEVLKLKPTLYRMLDQDEDLPKELGFIAQDVKDVIPQAYVENTGLNGNFIGLNFNPIVATLTKAIQEQQALIENLTTRLNALEGK